MKKVLEYLEIYFIFLNNCPVVLNKKKSTLLIENIVYSIDSEFIQEVINSDYDGQLEKIKEIHPLRKNLYYRTWRFAILHGRLPGEDDDLVLYTYIVENGDAAKTLPYYTTTDISILSSKNAGYARVVEKLEHGQSLRGIDVSVFERMKFDYFNDQLPTSLALRFKKILPNLPTQTFD